MHAKIYANFIKRNDHVSMFARAFPRAWKENSPACTCPIQSKISTGYSNWSSEKTEKGHNRKIPNFCCSRKMLTFLDSTKRVKVTQENANKKEMSGLDWLITLRRISFDKSKIQESVCQFLQKTYGNLPREICFLLTKQGVFSDILNWNWEGQF